MVAQALPLQSTAQLPLTQEVVAVVLEITQTQELLVLEALVAGAMVVM
jgi:hypothetical protein